MLIVAATVSHDILGMSCVAMFFLNQVLAFASFVALEVDKKGYPVPSAYGYYTYHEFSITASWVILLIFIVIAALGLHEKMGASASTMNFVVREMQGKLRSRLQFHLF